MLKLQFKKLFTVLRKNLTVIGLISVAAVVVTVGYITMYMTPVYSAEARLLIHNGEFLPITALYQNADSKAYIEACEEILNSDDIFNYFASTSGQSSEYTPEELSRLITVTANGSDSMIFRINAVTEDPQKSVNLITDFSRLLPGYLNSISARMSVNVIRCDTVAESAKPSVVSAAALALIAGAVLSSLAVILFSRFGTTLNSADDYKARYKAKLLGTVPDFDSGKGGN